MRRPLPIAAILAITGCAPELGDVPFSCGAGGLCPEGYSCRATVCVIDGASAGPARPVRVTWINSAEMYWVAEPGGGATLVVNDGFTPGAHGLYEIAMSDDGVPGAPRLLFGYGDEAPIASSVVALDESRYMVAMLRFPRVDEDRLVLEVLAIGRGAPEGTAPGIETLYRNEEELFLGGAEPPFIGAVAGQGTLDVAWTRPSQAGRVEVIRIARSGSVWNETRASEQPLPPEILPLSGDCALWPRGGDELVVRVGFESFAIGVVDAAGTLSPLAPVDGVPLYAIGDDVLMLRYAADDPSTEEYEITYARAGLDGQVIDEVPGGVLQGALEPYTATPFEGGALVAPLSDDPAFPMITVGKWTPPAPGPVPIASVPRTSTDEIYSARAYAGGSRVYVAWTEFHESLMDLWVATADASMTTRASGRRVIRMGGQ